MRLKSIAGQVAVVMGASSGIGRETALRFARRGAKVVAAARSQEDLRSLADQIQDEGGEAATIPADTSKFEQVKAVAERAVEEYGRLDIWVHLPGVSIFGFFDQIRPEEFERVIEVDLMGQVYGAMAALPHLNVRARCARTRIFHTGQAFGAIAESVLRRQARRRRLPRVSARGAKARRLATRRY